MSEEKKGIADAENSTTAETMADYARELEASFRTIREGDVISGTVIDVRTIMKCAVEKSATSMILCHNHPSGVADPSQADSTITARVREALNVIEVRTLDHVVVGEKPYSFAEHGLI